MKKASLYTFSILSIFFFCFSLRVQLSIKSFDSSKVKEHIDILSSGNYKGRLPGTIENMQTAAYIKEEFIKNNLATIDKDYYESFTVNFPSPTSGSPYLKVKDKKGNIVKEFTYGEDYREDMINFKKTSFNFTKKDNIYLSDNAINILKDEDYFLFYTPENHSFSFRSSFIQDSPFSMCVVVSKPALSLIKDYIHKDFKIECYIPFEIKTRTIYNVVGEIKGKHPDKPPVVVSAHFDHVGSDLNNNVYSGALDNASGSAFILELSRYISSLGKPDRTIIFAAFNAEEFNCIGSNEFLKKHKETLSGGKVYNFDMIGSSNNVPLSIMGGKEDSLTTPFLKSITATCTKQNVDYTCIFEDASDHSYFRKDNIDAVTFCDNDTSRIHTLADVSSYISTANIERCFKVVNKEIISNAFGNSFILLHHESMLLFSGLLLLLSLILLIKKLRKKH